MNNYFARFTEGAKKALVLAADAAKELGHNYVGTEHLLIGIAQELRSKKMVEKLSLIALPKANVIRGGVEKRIPVEELVARNPQIQDIGQLKEGEEVLVP